MEGIDLIRCLQGHKIRCEQRNRRKAIRDEELCVGVEDLA